MTITLRAPAGFSLRAAATFAGDFPATRAGNDQPDALSFAWPLDGDWRTASVVLRQHDNEIRGEIDGPHERELTAKIRRDVERILCHDIDADDFPGLGRHDPVVREPRCCCAPRTDRIDSAHLPCSLVAPRPPSAAPPDRHQQHLLSLRGPSASRQRTRLRWQQAGLWSGGEGTVVHAPQL